MDKEKRWFFSILLFRWNFKREKEKEIPKAGRVSQQRGWDSGMGPGWACEDKDFWSWKSVTVSPRNWGTPVAFIVSAFNSWVEWRQAPHQLRELVRFPETGQDAAATRGGGGVAAAAGESSSVIWPLWPRGSQASGSTAPRPSGIAPETQRSKILEERTSLSTSHHPPFGKELLVYMPILGLLALDAVPALLLHTSHKSGRLLPEGCFQASFYQLDSDCS